MRQYDPRRIAPAATRRVEPQRAMTRKAPAVAPAPKTTDEINDLFHAASRGARLRSLQHLHNLEQGPRRRLR